MKFRVTVEKEITVEFDENSSEFKELWDGYKEAIDSGADYQSFAESIAQYVSRYGVSDFIEGVGYVKHNGNNQRVFDNGKYEEQKGIVNVEVDTDINNMVEFEVAYSRLTNED